MAEVSYIFGDALTGEILQEIRCSGVSLKKTLDGGEFRASFSLDQTGKDNDTLTSATIPGRCYCIVERDGVVVGDFILWTRTYQSQAKSMQLYGIPWKVYTETRKLTVDYSAVDLDRRNIIIDLYQLMQADPNSLQVVLPGDFTPSGLEVASLASIEVLGSELKTFREVIDTVADTTDGCDWLVRTSRVQNTYTRTLEIGHPFIGALDEPGNVTFEYMSGTDGPGGNVSNYWVNDSMATAGTHIFGVGAGEGSSMLIAEIAYTDLLESGFPRFDTDYSRKDLTDASLLMDVTSQEGLNRRPPRSILTLEVKAEAEPVFGSYDVGDACRVIITDPRFPDGFQKDTRILSIEYYPPEDSNVEFARLTFEGED